MDNIEGFDNFGRPSWDLWFMSLAFMVSQRSIDPVTKHGTIAVSDDKTILAVGFNGPPRNCIDEKIPLTRPEKYGFIAHSEEQCIVNSARKGISLEGSTFYITGYPCSVCMRKILSLGVKKIVYGPVWAKCVDEESRKITDIMLEGQSIEIVEFKDVDQILKVVFKTQDYIINKLNP